MPKRATDLWATASVSASPAASSPGKPARKAPGAAMPPTPPAVSGPDADLHSAWRLAYIAIGDRVLATEAATQAFAQLAAADPGSQPSRRDLLATTLRFGLRSAAGSPDVAPDRVAGSAVITAMWQLPPNQRAALWLTHLNDVDNEELGAILGLSPANAEHVAARAAGWLDVALDHGSGPLCQHEPKLRDFLAGKLPMVEAGEIDDHLPGCPTCGSKVNAYEELSDLPVVLGRAVPDVPAAVTVDALVQRPPEPFISQAASGEPGRPAAVRPLAACCAALLALGLVGAGVMKPTHHANSPVSTSGTGPGITQPAPSGSGTGSTGETVPVTTSAPAPTTTTTVQPAVTFPTIPAGGPPRTTPRR